jgi:hypothetical protein
MADAKDFNFSILPETNKDWSKSNRGMLLTGRNLPLIRPDSKVFTVGSCFAYEVRKALKARNIEVFPKWNDIDIDFDTQIVAHLHNDDNISHYDSFVLLQEFRDALKDPELTEQDFLQLPDTPAGRRLGVDTVWQDPYRKQVYGASFEAVSDISRKFSACIRQGMDDADIFILTLGLIEVWVNPDNGRYFCRPPGTGFNGGVGRDRARFHLSSFEENLHNVRQIVDLLISRYPDKHVVLSVSPVALERTFTGNDVIVANTYSKSLLRAVAGQVMHEYAATERVHYMPSYEVSQRIDIFEEDGRHVTENAARFITDLFRLLFSEHANVG